MPCTSQAWVSVKPTADESEFGYTRVHVPLGEFDDDEEEEEFRPFRDLRLLLVQPGWHFQVDIDGEYPYGGGGHEYESDYCDVSEWDSEEGSSEGWERSKILCSQLGDILLDDDDGQGCCWLLRFRPLDESVSMTNDTDERSPRNSGP